MSVHPLPVSPHPGPVFGDLSTAESWYVVRRIPGQRWRRARVAAWAVILPEPFTSEAVIPLVASRNLDGTPCLEPAGEGFLRHQLDHGACTCGDPLVELADPLWCERCAAVA